MQLMLFRLEDLFPWDNNEEEEDSCPICLLQYQEREKIRILPCGHTYHPKCIDLWLSEHTSCPQCRRSVLPSGKYGDNKEDDIVLEERIHNRIMFDVNERGNLALNYAEEEDDGRW
mmetsp:Transcript_779/g.1580  ORF Transcript_779/g.1580 Transcript_779/m.1580 type:complete len:116 (+) Transcript_779:2218-2565(+)